MNERRRNLKNAAITGHFGLVFDDSAKFLLKNTDLSVIWILLQNWSNPLYRLVYLSDTQNFHRTKALPRKRPSKEIQYSFFLWDFDLMELGTDN